MDAASTTLFERKAGRGEKAVALALSVGLVLVGILVTPLASEPGPDIPGFMPAFTGAMIVIDLVLAVLLFSKGAIAQRVASVRLGTAYLFAALIIVPHVAAFPGALVSNGLIGSSASAVWLWSFWHTGFAVAICRHVTARQGRSRRHAIRDAVLGTIATVIALTLLSTAGLPWLPSVLTGQSYHYGAFAIIMQTVVVPANVAALALVLVRRRLRSAEDVWLTIAMMAACVDVWLTFRAGSRFSVGWYVARAASLVTSTVVLVSLFRDITQLYSKVAQANQLLAELAHVDGLTGLANRRHFDASLATEWRRAQRDGRPLSVIMIDVDQFKAFNDSYGHQDGDTCLKAVAACLGARARRPGDLAARYGGEEFALVLPATDLAGAAFLGEALRVTIRDLALPHAASPHRVVTVSVGVASTVPMAVGGPDLLLRAADAALYRAKQAGRDRCCQIAVGSGADTPASDEGGPRPKAA